MSSNAKREARERRVRYLNKHSHFHFNRLYRFDWQHQILSYDVSVTKVYYESS